MKEGGFNLGEWSSNSPLMNSVVVSGDVCSNAVVKVLGVPWRTDINTLVLQPYAPPVSDAVTKQEMVGALSKTFDPYGVLMPLCHWQDFVAGCLEGEVGMG